MINVTPIESIALTADETDALLPLIGGHHDGHALAHAGSVPGEQRFSCSCGYRAALAEGVLADGVERLRRRRETWNREHLVPSAWMAL